MHGSCATAKGRCLPLCPRILIVSTHWMHKQILPHSFLSFSFGQGASFKLSSYSVTMDKFFSRFSRRHISFRVLFYEMTLHLLIYTCISQFYMFDKILNYCQMTFIYWLGMKERFSVQFHLAFIMLETISTSFSQGWKTFHLFHIKFPTMPPFLLMCHLINDKWKSHWEWPYLLSNIGPHVELMCLLFLLAASFLQFFPWLTKPHFRYIFPPSLTGAYLAKVICTADFIFN